MKRLITLVIALAVLCGCRNQSPPGSDPFFGRTAVPPPPTGAIRPCDPYYRAVPAPNAPLAPIPQAQQPGVTLPPPGAGSPTRYDPPGGNFNYRGASTGQSNSAGAGGQDARAPSESLVAQAAAATTPSRIKIVEPKIIEPKTSPRPANENDTAVAVAATTDAKGLTWASAAGATPEATRAAINDPLGGPLNGRPRVVRPLQPRPQAEIAPTSSASPVAGLPAAADLQRPGSPAKSVDIMQLPPAGSSTSSGSEKSRSAAAGFRLVSEGTAAADSSGVVAADYSQSDPPPRGQSTAESRFEK